MRMPPLEQKKPRNRDPAVPVAGTLCVTGTFKTARATAASRPGLRRCLAAVDRLRELDRGDGLVDGTANVFMFVDVSQPWRTPRSPTHAHAAISRSACGTSWTSTIRRRTDPRGARQPLGAFSCRSVRSAWTAEARRILNRLEFHFTPQARQLAQHGRDRDRRVGRSMPRSSDPRQGDPHQGDRRMGAPSRIWP